MSSVELIEETAMLRNKKDSPLDDRRESFVVFGFVIRKRGGLDAHGNGIY